MKILDKSIEIIILYDLYQNLLTNKQKAYFEDYYFNDYSLQEISDNFDVSRNAVHDQLKRTVQKLQDLEEKLSLKDQNKKRQIIISKIKDSNENQEVANLINELEKVE